MYCVLEIEVRHGESYHCEELMQEFGERVVLLVRIPVFTSYLLGFLVSVSMVVSKL